jgi:polyhydroxybutyrate depolymerase
LTLDCQILKLDKGSIDGTLNALHSVHGMTMLALLLLLSVSPPKEIHLKIDGRDRLAYVIAPSAHTSAKPPVIFMFHGHGGSAQRCMDRFGMEKRWPQAVVVYCDGLPINGGGGLAQGWEIDTIERNRDIKYFDALLPEVLSEYHADPKKVFAWGFSNGGMFMYTLWSMRPDKIAAFCASGACFANNDIHLDVPKPAFITLSANDPIVPPNLQEAAFEQVEKTDRSAKSGRHFGAGTLLKGAKPVVVWRYNGGHEFPFESFPKLIEFFKSIH